MRYMDDPIYSFGVCLVTHVFVYIEGKHWRPELIEAIEPFDIRPATEDFIKRV